MTENNENKELFSALSEMREAQQRVEDYNHKQAEQFWNNLSYEDKLYAFYSVCHRIYKADVINRSSYRHSLYHVFGFDVDSYGIGMQCGYLEIHNLIYSGLERTRNVD